MTKYDTSRHVTPSSEWDSTSGWRSSRSMSFSNMAHRLCFRFRRRIFSFRLLAWMSRFVARLPLRWLRILSTELLLPVLCILAFLDFFVEGFLFVPGRGVILLLPDVSACSSEVGTSAAEWGSNPTSNICKLSSARSGKYASLVAAILSEQRPLLTWQRDLQGDWFFIVTLGFVGGVTGWPAARDDRAGRRGWRKWASCAFSTRSI